MHGMADIGITARSTASHYTWEKMVLKYQKVISWSEMVNLLVEFDNPLQSKEN